MWWPLRMEPKPFDAYKKASLSANPFVGVILDLTVRDGMDGREAIEQLLAFDPEVKAIVSSGYSTDPIMSAYQDYGFKGVVSKPYGTEELLSTLREMIQENKPEEGRGSAAGRLKLYVHLLHPDPPEHGHPRQKENHHG